jgi:hypothetical protein
MGPTKKKARRLVTGVLGSILALTGLVALAVPAQAAVRYPSTPEVSWRVNGIVYTTTIVGDRVFVGGAFTQAISPTGTSVARTNLAAFDIGTGALITGWRADAGSTVRALASDGSSLWVGGNFAKVNNVAALRVAKVSVATGAVDSGFQASADAGVRALALSGPSLFIGGTFLNVNGVAKNRVAKIDAASGLLTMAFGASAGGPVYGLVKHPLRDLVYVSGDFSTLNSSNRTGVGALNATTGTTAGQPFDSSARPTLGLDINEDGSRLFGAGGSATNSAAAWSTTSGTRTWRQVTDGDIQAIAYRDDTVYFGFHDGWQGDGTIKLLAADATTGALDAAFRPHFNLFWGVYALDITDAGLSVGGNFTRVSGVQASYWARFLPA